MIMKRNILIALCAVLILVLAGCASSDNGAASEGGRPDWVLSQAHLQTQDKHYVVGYGHMSNFRNSLSFAQADARNQMAIWVNVAIDNIVTTYINDAGVSESTNRQSMDAFENISKQRAQAMLSGLTQEDVWEDEDGGVYVLMSLSADGVMTSLEDVNEEVFVKNEAAQEANDMMRDALKTYFGTPSLT